MEFVSLVGRLLWLVGFIVYDSVLYKRSHVSHFIFPLLYPHGSVKHLKIAEFRRLFKRLFSVRRM